MQAGICDNQWTSSFVHKASCTELDAHWLSRIATGCSLDFIFYVDLEGKFLRVLINVFLGAKFFSFDDAYELAVWCDNRLNCFLNAVRRSRPENFPICKFCFEASFSSLAPFFLSFSSAAQPGEIYACVFLDHGHHGRKKLGTCAVRRCRYDLIDSGKNCLSDGARQNIFTTLGEPAARTLRIIVLLGLQSLRQMYPSLCTRGLHRSADLCFESDTFYRIDQFGLYLSDWLNAIEVRPLVTPFWRFSKVTPLLYG